MVKTGTAYRLQLTGDLLWLPLHCQVMQRSNGNKVYRNACLALSLLAAYCTLGRRFPLAAAIAALVLFVVMPFLIGWFVPARNTAAASLSASSRQFQFRLNDLMRWVFLCALGALAARETALLFTFAPTTGQFVAACLLLVLCVIFVVPAAVLFWMRGKPRRETFVVAGFAVAWLTVVAATLALYAAGHL